MKRHFVCLPLVILMFLLVGCSPGAAADVIPKLLTGRGEIVPLNHISEYRGQIYASGFLCIPGWNPVPGVNTYTGGFAVVGDAVVYTRPQGSSPFPTELYRSDLNGGSETVIAGDVLSFGGVWAAGDRIIYVSVVETPDDELICNGVFWYDVNVSKSTRLLGKLDDDEFFSLISFDDDFVYYRTSQASDVRRVRWDGTQAEALRGVEFPFPDGFYKVEGEYYYFATASYHTVETELRRYSINSGKARGSYTIDTILAFKDGWAYYGDATGIYKINMANGEKVKLADLAPNVITVNSGIGFGWNVIIGDSIYFSASYTDVDYEKDDVRNTGLYKVPLNGGLMEFQNVEWFQS